MATSSVYSTPEDAPELVPSRIRFRPIIVTQEWVDIFFATLGPLETLSPDSCWIWPSTRTPPDNYGRIGLGADRKANSVPAHRWSYTYFIGPIPSGALVLHRCDQPPCVAPHHLFLGDQSNNIQDMLNKKRNNPHPMRGEENPMALLSLDQVEQIWTLRAQGLGPRKIGRVLGMPYKRVEHIVYGQRWLHAIPDQVPPPVRVQHKTTDDEIAQIWRLRRLGWGSILIARELSLGPSVVSNILSGKTYAHLRPVDAPTAVLHTMKG